MPSAAAGRRGGVRYRPGSLSPSRRRAPACGATEKRARTSSHTCGDARPAHRIPSRRSRSRTAVLARSPRSRPLATARCGRLGVAGRHRQPRLESTIVDLARAIPLRFRTSPSQTCPERSSASANSAARSSTPARSGPCAGTPRAARSRWPPRLLILDGDGSGRVGYSERRNLRTASTRRWSCHRGRQVELGEDRGDVLLHRTFADLERLSHRASWSALRPSVPAPRAHAGVRTASGSSRRRRPSSSPTTSGSSAEPPLATRRTASVKVSTSAMRSLSR